MKHIFTYFLLLLVFTVSSQNINQFDGNGNRHGIWKKNFDNTNVLRFEGQFNHGKEVGLFKFYLNVNKTAVLSATREFLVNDTKAHVKFYASNGKIISEGQMNGKIYIGEWKYYQNNSNQLLTLEHFDANGNLTGDRFIYYVNGKVAEKEQYKNGRLDGSSLWYSEEGKILKEFIYNNGELHGLSKYYSPTGELIIEGAYKEGQKAGIWKYYENGKLTEEKDYSK